MTINIPEWVLWAIGLPVGTIIICGVLFLAYIGWQFLSIDFRFFK